MPLVVEMSQFYDSLHAVLAYRVRAHHDALRLRRHSAPTNYGPGRLRWLTRRRHPAARTRHFTAARGRVDAGGSRPSRRRLGLWPAPPEWERGAAAFATGRSSRRRSTSRCARPGARCTTCSELEPRPVRLRQLARPRRRSLRSSRCAGGLPALPVVRFKLDAEATWAPALVDEVAATGRRRHDRLQGPVRLRGRGSGGARRAV